LEEVQLGPKGEVGEDLPRNEQLGKVVVLHKVGRRGTGRLDLLVAVADGCEDDGAIADELVVPVCPNNGANDAVGLGRVRGEPISRNFVPAVVREGVADAGGIGVSEGFLGGICETRPGDDMLAAGAPCADDGGGVVGGVVDNVLCRHGGGGE